MKSKNILKSCCFWAFLLPFLFATNAFGITKYQIPAKTRIPVILKSDIKTSSSYTIAVEVEKDVYDPTKKHLLIPKGSRLIGEYYTCSAPPNRHSFLLIFHTLIYPNDSTASINKAANVIKTPKDYRENITCPWERAIKNSTISTILTIGVGAASTNPDKAEDRTAPKPTIILDPGHPFGVSVKKDMSIAPYNPKKKKNER